MKRIATIIVGLALLVPSTALAQTNATCQGYSQKVCNVSDLNQNQGPSSTSSPSNAVNAASNTTTGTSSSSLPFTGLDLGLLVVGGAALLGTGLVVRRASRGLN